MPGPYTRIKHRAWTYETAILDRLDDGRTIGNATYYSETSLRHQERARVAEADILLDRVPLGTDDLRAWHGGRPLREAPASDERGVAAGRTVLVPG